MSLGLLIDTSMIGVSLAICDFGAGKIEWKYSHPEQYGSAAKLSQLFLQGLQATGKKASDFEKILVSNGPGSFTGIKVGLSWAYGFAASNPTVKWQGISSLSSVAHYLQVRSSKEGPLLVLLPSTKTHGYMAHIASQDSEATPYLVQAGIDQGPYGSLLELSQSAQIFWAGHWEKMQNFLSNRGASQTSLNPSELLEAGLQGMYMLAVKSPESAWSKHFPTPNYLRKSTAEERLEAQKGALLKNEKIN